MEKPIEDQRAQGHSWESGIQEEKVTGGPQNAQYVALATVLVPRAVSADQAVVGDSSDSRPGRPLCFGSSQGS